MSINPKKPNRNASRYEHSNPRIRTSQRHRIKVIATAKSWAQKAAASKCQRFGCSQRRVNMFLPSSSVAVAALQNRKPKIPAIRTSCRKVHRNRFICRHCTDSFPKIKRSAGRFTTLQSSCRAIARFTTDRLPPFCYPKGNLQLTIVPCQ